MKAKLTVSWAQVKVNNISAFADFLSHITAYRGMHFNKIYFLSLDLLG